MIPGVLAHDHWKYVFMEAAFGVSIVMAPIDENIVATAVPM